MNGKITYSSRVLYACYYIALTAGIVLTLGGLGVAVGTHGDYSRDHTYLAGLCAIVCGAVAFNIAAGRHLQITHAAEQQTLDDHVLQGQRAQRAVLRTLQDELTTPPREPHPPRGRAA